MHGNSKGLIVDDDARCLEFTRELVARMCPEVEFVAFPAAAEALSFFAKNQVELIITDYRMPGMDGVQFAREVRAQASEVPIIMISGDNVEHEAMTSGVTLFLAKPVSAKELAAAVHRFRKQRLA